MKTDLIERRDLTDQCYDVIKQHILTRHFVPNEKLSVERLSQWLRVSRSPVKDAVNRLAAEGLITVRPRVGSFVTPVKQQDIAEVFEIRKLIELHAAAKGIERITAAQVLALQALVAEMAVCIDGDHYQAAKFDQFLKLDTTLHEKIVALAGNKRLLKIYAELKVNMHIARVYYVKKTTNALTGHRQHEQIVQALTVGDLTTLKKVLAQHIDDVGREIGQNLALVGGVL